MRPAAGLAPLLVTAVMSGCAPAPPAPSSSSSSIPAVPSASVDVSSSPIAPTVGASADGRPLNALEKQTIDALGRIGLPAGPMEYGFNNAFVWAGSPDVSELLVSAVRITDDRSDFVAGGQRTIAGVRVEDGVFGGSGSDLADRFVCHGVNYYVRGTPPRSFVDTDAFIAAFVAVLGCSNAA